MNFLTSQQFLDCLSCTTYDWCVRLFWRELLEINPNWDNLSSLATSKREWDVSFRSIDGIPYSRKIPSKVTGNDEIEIRIRALIGKPNYSCHPTELFVYPFSTPLWDGRYKSHTSKRRVIKKVIVYLDEIRNFVKDPDWITRSEDSGLWLERFDQSEHKYHDFYQLVDEARKNLRRIQILKERAALRKR